MTKDLSNFETQWSDAHFLSKPRKNLESTFGNFFKARPAVFITNYT